MIIHKDYVAEPFVECRYRLEYMDTLLVVSRRAGDLHMCAFSTFDERPYTHPALFAVREQVVKDLLHAVDAKLLPRAFGDFPEHPSLSWE